MEDIASWMEAFAIFALNMVSCFLPFWKDIMQYQLLMLGTYCVFICKCLAHLQSSFLRTQTTHYSAHRLVIHECAAL